MHPLFNIGKNITVTVDDNVSRAHPLRFFSRFGIYLLALIVLLLNLRQISDNVLWGDEAFSVLTARNTPGGINEILYYLDCHPPLYYYVLSGLLRIFGEHGWVFHLSAMIPFIAILLFTVTIIQKQLGRFSSATLILLTGLAAPCARYNVEVRMYSFAFSAAFLCAWFSYRVLCGQKKAWIGMVLSATVAAYSHYFGLATCGLLLVCTTIAAQLFLKKRSLLYGLCSIAGMIVLYIPWIPSFLNQKNAVDQTFWVTEPHALSSILHFIFGGERMWPLTSATLVLSLLLLIPSETKMISIIRTGGLKKEITLSGPHLYRPNEKSAASFTILATILATVVFGYGYSSLIRPIFLDRYAYPMTALLFVALTLVLSSCREQLLKIETATVNARSLKYLLVYGTSIIFLCVLTVFGRIDMREYRAQYILERDATERTLQIIADTSPPPHVKMVSNGVRHLGWTVLPYYFPSNEAPVANLRDVDDDEFWYFNNTFLTDEEVRFLEDSGYIVYGFEEQRIAQYTFVLYRFVR